MRITGTESEDWHKANDAKAETYEAKADELLLKTQVRHSLRAKSSVERRHIEWRESVELD